MCDALSPEPSKESDFTYFWEHPLGGTLEKRLTDGDRDRTLCWGRGEWQQTSLTNSQTGQLGYFTLFSSSFPLIFLLFLLFLTFYGHDPSGLTVSLTTCKGSLLKLVVRRHRANRIGSLPLGSPSPHA
jgi:hypothetical protein